MGRKFSFVSYKDEKGLGDITVGATRVDMASLAFLSGYTADDVVEGELEILGTYVENTYFTEEGRTVQLDGEDVYYGCYTRFKQAIMPTRFEETEEMVDFLYRHPLGVMMAFDNSVHKVEEEGRYMAVKVRVRLKEGKERG